MERSHPVQLDELRNERKYRRQNGRGRMIAWMHGGERGHFVEDFDFRGVIAITIAAKAAAAAMAAGMARRMAAMSWVVRHHVAGETSAQRAHECYPNLNQHGMGAHTHLSLNLHLTQEKRNRSLALEAFAVTRVDLGEGGSKQKDLGGVVDPQKDEDERSGGAVGGAQSRTA